MVIQMCNPDLDSAESGSWIAHLDHHLDPDPDFQKKKNFKKFFFF